MNDKVTGGDLFKLWQVANVCLPRTAKTYTDASGGLGGTTGGTDGGTQFSDTEAFQKSDSMSPHGEPGGRVFASWSALRDEMHLIMGTTAQNLLYAQEALNTAIAQYQEEDDSLAADLTNNYLNNPEKHDKNDPSQNPPTGDDKPGKPSLPEYYTSPADN